MNLRICDTNIQSILALVLIFLYLIFFLIKMRSHKFRTQLNDWIALRDFLGIKFWAANLDFLGITLAAIFIFGLLANNIDMICKR